jgi:hypothetical protein
VGAVKRTDAPGHGLYQGVEVCWLPAMPTLIMDRAGAVECPGRHAARRAAPPAALELETFAQDVFEMEEAREGRPVPGR